MTKQLVFIDESGDPGFKAKSSANFSFALVVFEDTEQAEEAEKAINNAAVLSRHLSEFKYSKTCNHVKDIFFNEISKCSFRAKALYVNKMEITSEELRNNANKFYNFFLKQVITHAQLSDASLKLDGKKDTVKSAFQNRFHNVPPSFYSLRIAASGLSFIARSAGKNPATIPTSTANASDITTSQIGM